MVRKQIISTKRSPTPLVPLYSQAVRAGDTIYLSGTTGRAPDGKMALGDARAQSVQALENIKAILEEAGSSIEQIVKLTIFFTRPDDVESIIEARAMYFKREPPAVTMVRVAGLAREGMLVEFDATAIAS